LIKKFFAFGLFFFAEIWLEKIILAVQKLFFLNFSRAKIIIQKRFKKIKKVAVDMGVGRPKLEIARTENLHLRLTKFEAEKISRIAKQKNLTKTQAILQGIDLLIHYKPKKIASRSIKEILKERGVDTSDLDKIL